MEADDLIGGYYFDMKKSRRFKDYRSKSGITIRILTLRPTGRSRRLINPVVALNSVFVIIEPLPIEGRTLPQCYLPDHFKGDF